MLFRSNSSTMATQWSALASSDVRQLKRQLDDLHSLPSHCCFVNYLRCHDDIGWGLNEEFGKSIGMDPLEHKNISTAFSKAASQALTPAGNGITIILLPRMHVPAAQRQASAASKRASMNRMAGRCQWASSAT